jgi:Rhodanese-like domain
VGSRFTAFVATAPAVLLAASCVVWPGGTGPGAKPLPLDEALALVARNEAVLVDVRTPEAYAAGHIPRAVNVPADQVVARAAEFRRMGLPILYCG